MSDIKDFVDSLSGGDNVSAETHFNSIITNKVGDALAVKRQEVSQSMIKNHVPETPEEESSD
mgnify:FL=1|jgi:hypothetical protein|tara:strand:+ start:593 stop:778 length:186 start_codon:yes stop_codon:yes gene_type:complete